MTSADSLVPAMSETSFTHSAHPSAYVPGYQSGYEAYLGNGYLSQDRSPYPDQAASSSHAVPDIAYHGAEPWPHHLEYELEPYRKHDFAKGGGWEDQGYGYGQGYGGLKKAKEVKALFVLMAPLLLLAVFGPLLATQAMLPWVTGAGITTVSTVASGRRRRRRAVQNLDARTRLYLEVQEFLRRSGSRGMVEAAGESLLHCQPQGRCMERLACEATDQSSPAARDERRIARKVLRNVLTNPMFPSALKERLKRGITEGKKRSSHCSVFKCTAVDKSQ